MDANVWSLQYLSQALFYGALMVIAVRWIVKHIKD